MRQIDEQFASKVGYFRPEIGYIFGSKHLILGRKSRDIFRKIGLKIKKKRPLDSKIEENIQILE